MARKELITKEKISETAFALAKAEGIENVTARKLAAKIGCSTQPIFRIYENMGELYNEIYQKVASFLWLLLILLNLSFILDIVSRLILSIRKPLH